MVVLQNHRRECFNSALNTGVRGSDRNPGVSASRGSFMCLQLHSTERSLEGINTKSSFCICTVTSGTEVTLVSLTQWQSYIRTLLFGLLVTIWVHWLSNFQCPGQLWRIHLAEAFGSAWVGETRGKVTCKTLLQNLSDHKRTGLCDNGKGPRKN